MEHERRLVPVLEIEPAPQDWLWQDRIPLGAITVLDGDPGRGKSAMTLDLAARVSRGEAMPLSAPATGPGGVVLIQAEDDLSTRILPTLKAAGANLDLVRVYDQTRFGHDPLRLPDDLGSIEAAVKEAGARLVVLDPLVAFLGSASPNSDQAVRRCLGPLASLASRMSLSVLVVRHLKKAGGPPVYRGGGSIGIVGLARSALLVGPDPTPGDPHRHVLAQTKSNLSRAKSLLYRTSKIGGRIGLEWLGESEATADEILSAPSASADGSALQDAMYTLYSILEDGPVAASEVASVARRAGVAKRTLDRAKKLLKVRSRKHGSGKGSSWTWELPDDETLIRPFKERDLDELMDKLLHGSPSDEPGPIEAPMPWTNPEDTEEEDWKGD